MGSNGSKTWKMGVKKISIDKEMSEKVQKNHLKLTILPRFQLKLSQELKMIEKNGFTCRKLGSIISRWA
jgi:hypothetical protein